MKMRFESNLFCCLLIIGQSIALVIGGSDKPLTPCPKECRCVLENGDRPEVVCTQEKLESVPPTSEWPENIYSIDISMNRIKRIDVMESNDNLKYLDLASNLIEVIEPNAFEHLPELRGIDLSHNQLTTLPKELFTHNLQTLNLSSNNIELLPMDLFDKCIYLQELRLAHNPLRILDSDLFRFSGQLKTLDMSSIGAIAIKDDIFHYLFELSELDLSDNDFMLVPTIPLRSARVLKVLKLSGNPIHILDEYSFVKFNTLTELYLDDMKELKEIKSKTFSSMYNLQKISISNNPHLFYIDSHAFYGTFNRSWIAIKEAYIRANRLSTLSENTLPFCNLTTLDIRENPWTCDCHLLWAKYCHLRPELTKGVICANPTKLRGRELDLIDHQNLYCEHNQFYREVKMLRLFIIVFVAFTLFFIALVFVLFLKRDRVIRWWTDRKRGDGAIYYMKAHSNPMDTIEPEF